MKLLTAQKVALLLASSMITVSAQAWSPWNGGGPWNSGPNFNNWNGPWNGGPGFNNWNGPWNGGPGFNNWNGPWNGGPGFNNWNGPWNGGPGFNNWNGPWNGGPGFNNWNGPWNGGPNFNNWNAPGYGGGGPWNGYTGIGPVDAIIDGDFEVNMSFRGHGTGSGDAYGNAYGSGYSAPVYGYYPVQTPAVAPAPIAVKTAKTEITDGDGDKDGVADSRDLCPSTSAGQQVDYTGCEANATITLRGVNFETDSENLTAESSIILDRVVRTLTDNAQVKLEVAGHTDSQGEPAYNLDLSQRRAAMVRQYLVDHGVNGENLTARGYGQGQPIASNGDAEGRAENRRVELVRQDK